MGSKLLFRIFILGVFITDAIYISLMFVLERDLPPSLSAYVASQLENVGTTTDIVIGIGLLVILVASFYSMIALLFFAGHARVIFIASFVLGALLSLNNPPTVQTALETFVITIGTLLCGIIITLMYTEPLKIEFEK